MATKSSASYADRAKSHANALARRLFEIAESKQTNITVSADLTTTKELLAIAEGRASLQGSISKLVSSMIYPWILMEFSSSLSAREVCPPDHNDVQTCLDLLAC